MSRVVPLFLCVLLVVPTVTATWYGPGTFEPDTPQDVEHGTMWDDADATPGGAMRLYFNAFQTSAAGVVNPNVGLAQSRVETAGLVQHRALLGVWKDCNRDGYIGLAEGGVQDYRSELLLDASVCPAASRFNDGLWVNELLTVGMVDPCEYESEEVRARDCAGVDGFHENERVFYAPGTRVWGDFGAPGDIPGGRCIVAPVPRGTLSSTGGALRYADCRTGHAVAGEVNALDSDGSLGLAFEDVQNPQRSSSLLNQPLPVALAGDGARAGLLERDSGRPLVTAWDCSQPRGTADLRVPFVPDELVVSDPTGGQLTGPRFPFVIVGVYFRDEDNDPSTPGTIRARLADDEGAHAHAPALAPALGNASDASAWDAATAFVDGPLGDCDPATGGPLDAAHPGVLTGGADLVEPARKTQVDIVFSFFDGHRGLDPRLDPTTGARTPSDGGQLYSRDGRGGSGPLWSALAPVEQRPAAVDRFGLGGAAPSFFTYYAEVGAVAFDAGFSTAAGNIVMLYGADACGALVAGVSRGWVCDASLWWRDAAGQDIMPRYAQGLPRAPVPGWPYHLRDVDCLDMSPAALVARCPAVGAAGTE